MQVVAILLLKCNINARLLTRVHPVRYSALDKACTAHVERCARQHACRVVIQSASNGAMRDIA